MKSNVPDDLGVISERSDEKSGMAFEYAFNAFCGSEGLSRSRDIPVYISNHHYEKVTEPNLEGKESGKFLPLPTLFHRVLLVPHYRPKK